MSQKKLLIIIVLLAVAIAGMSYALWRRYRNQPAGCPAGRSFVRRVLGGWQKTVVSDPEGRCVPDEVIERTV